MIHDGTENGRHSKARVIVWKSYRWGREEFPVADRPMPENITDFEAIHLRFAIFLNNNKSINLNF
jgi:hypothetical protein